MDVDPRRASTRRRLWRSMRTACSTSPIPATTRSAASRRWPRHHDRRGSARRLSRRPGAAGAVQRADRHGRRSLAAALSSPTPTTIAFGRSTPDGTSTTLAGTAGPGCVDGPAPSARFDTPCGVAVDAAGTFTWPTPGTAPCARSIRTGRCQHADTCRRPLRLRPIGIAIGRARREAVRHRRARTHHRDWRRFDMRRSLDRWPASATAPEGRTIPRRDRHGTAEPGPPRRRRRGQSRWSGLPRRPRAARSFRRRRRASHPHFEVERVRAARRCSGRLRRWMARTKSPERSAKRAATKAPNASTPASTSASKRERRCSRPDGTVSQPIATADFGSLNESLRHRPDHLRAHPCRPRSPQRTVR